MQNRPSEGLIRFHPEEDSKFVLSQEWHEKHILFLKVLPLKAQELFIDDFIELYNLKHRKELGRVAKDISYVELRTHAIDYWWALLPTKLAKSKSYSY